MKVTGMPLGMWQLFRNSFERKLTDVLGMNHLAAAKIARKAKMKYREIVISLPEFETGDRFKMNILSCAMLSAFLLSMEVKPTLEQVTVYYHEAMMTRAMRWFCRRSGRKKFSEKDIQEMKATAAFHAADRNPYSWNMDFLPYADDSGYEARFSRCGICTLMRELGLYVYVPAMCSLDYVMCETGGTSHFIRQYTLASGGPYCDCGYLMKAGNCHGKNCSQN